MKAILDRRRQVVPHCAAAAGRRRGFERGTGKDDYDKFGLADYIGDVTG